MQTHFSTISGDKSYSQATLPGMGEGDPFTGENALYKS